MYIEDIPKFKGPIITNVIYWYISIIIAWPIARYSDASTEINKRKVIIVDRVKGYDIDDVVYITDQSTYDYSTGKMLESLANNINN